MYDGVFFFSFSVSFDELFSGTMSSAKVPGVDSLGPSHITSQLGNDFVCF